MRSTRHWKRRWTETATIQALRQFTFLMNWPDWRPSRKTWSSFLVKTGERRSLSQQPLGDTATESNRWASSHWVVFRLFSFRLTTPVIFFQIGKENPEYLMAHAYTRYLGDLSGGQVLGRIAQKSLKLSSSDGVSFFAFPGVSSPNLFKQLYRSRMNSVELTEEQRSEVLEEAVRAFEFNIQVRLTHAEWVKEKNKSHGDFLFSV